MHMRLKLHHILIGFLIFTLITSFLRNSAALKRNATFFTQLQKEYDEQKVRNDKLKLQNAKSSNPFEIEKIMRNKLGFVKAGEEVVIIQDTSPTTTPSPTPGP
ncbi:MAG: septum formation initiator family protein [Candidatus Roizmanbacteria bacterium]